MWSFHLVKKCVWWFTHDFSKEKINIQSLIRHSIKLFLCNFLNECVSAQSERILYIFVWQMHVERGLFHRPPSQQQWRPTPARAPHPSPVTVCRVTPRRRGCYHAYTGDPASLSSSRKKGTETASMGFTAYYCLQKLILQPFKNTSSSSINLSQIIEFVIHLLKKKTKEIWETMK